jgi:hypothetical protein
MIPRPGATSPGMSTERHSGWCCSRASACWPGFSGWARAGPTGVPLKLSAGTSGFILSIVDSSAAWVYLNKGALIAIVAAPSVIGMMLGAFIGGRLLKTLKASMIRKLVIVILLFAGVRALTKGLGWWT